MKKYLLIIVVNLLCINVIAQTYELNVEARVKPVGSTGNYKSTTITKLEHNTIGSRSKCKEVYNVYFDGEQKKLTDYEVLLNPKNIDEYWNYLTIKNVLKRLSVNGIQYDVRQDLEDDAIDYVNRIKSQGMELNDPYLENYIYSLITKISPKTYIDGRPGNINLLLVDSPDENACMFSNGTLVIYAGLLAHLHSEDELVAILSHEIAHFMLDHSINNVNEELSRQKRAEFWTALSTGATAAMEVAVASNNKYYVPGAATLAVAQLSTVLAEKIIERSGMKYNHEQESEADEAAINVLKFLNYDTNAMASALSRLQDEMEKERNTAMYLNSYTHPALKSRIQKAGDISNRKQDLAFEKTVSFAVSSTARYKYESRRFRQTLELTNQNIANGVAIPEDYIISAYCLLALDNSEKSNRDVIQLINKAKQLDANNLNIFKAEIIAELRNKNVSQAVLLLKEYSQKLQKYNELTSLIKSENTWDKTNAFINSENKWVDNMLIKLGGK